MAATCFNFERGIDLLSICFGRGLDRIQPVLTCVHFGALELHSCLDLELKLDRIGFKALLRCCVVGLEALERFLLKLCCCRFPFYCFRFIFFPPHIFFGFFFGKALPKTARNDFIWKSLWLHVFATAKVSVCRATAIQSHISARAILQVRLLANKNERLRQRT